MGEEACTSQNPTCFTPLQKGIQILAIIDMVVGFARFLTLLFMILFCFGDMKAEVISLSAVINSPLHPRDLGLVFIFLLLFVIVEMVLDAVLFLGAKNGDMRMCKIFLIGAGILGILSLLGFLGYYLLAHLIIYILWIPYRIYILICVSKFVKK